MGSKEGSEMNFSLIQYSQYDKIKRLRWAGYIVKMEEDTVYLKTFNK
jgi:hypothetical protein